MKSHLRNAMSLLVLAIAAGAGNARAATVTLDLWARPGSVTLPGSATPVTIWGFATSAAGAAVIPGPVLVATEGDTVVVNLVNGLAERMALAFTGQGVPPDQVGVVAGGAVSYTFTAAAAGTFLYEAGLLPGTQHQAAMGLYGALVVRPLGAPGQAYAGAATAFDEEAVLVLSELDPAMGAAPASFDLRNYAPRYFLINGRPYPNTAPIATVPGHRVLLRYLNAGLQHHSMSLLGLNQTVIAQDGLPRPFGQAVVAETIAPGQTLDAITTIPAATLAGARFPLFDGSLKLYNGSGAGAAAGFGGMLTFLTSEAASGGTGAGPATSGVAAAPNPTSGDVAVAVTATVTADLTVNPANAVTAAELFVDAPGAAGSGLAMSGAFGAATVAVSGTIPAATAAALLAGPHTIYVHGLDAGPAWGSFATATLTVDRTGPTAGAVALTPNPANGAVAVAIASTISMPGGAVAGAEYFVDTAGAAGTGTAMGGTFGGATAAASGTLTPAALASLASGSHAVYVHGRSATGTWGAFNFGTLNLDKAGPATSGPTLTPALVGAAVDVAVHATGDDTATGGGTIAAAEYAIDAGAPVALTVNLPATVASLDGTIPAAAVGALTAGGHAVAIRSRDALGNWGTPVTVTLTVDRTGPATTGLAIAPNPANGTVAVRLGASLADPAGVVAAEGFVDGAASPAPGSGFPLIPADGAFGGTPEAAYADLPQPTVAALAVGTHTVRVRGKDGAGNWGPLASTTFGRSAQAVADALTITSSTSSTPQVVNVAAPGLLANDLPNEAGRTTTLASGPVRTSGTGTGTIAVTCGGATTAGVCTNGSYRVTLTPASGSAAARQASKRGTYQFTYRTTLNGIQSAPATVTITVN